MISSQPDNLLEFETFLGMNGFKRIGDETPEDAMGYRRIEYVGTNIRVLLERDRGFWDIKIADNKIYSEKWYQLLLFTYVLPGRNQPRLPIEEQIKFAIVNWPHIIDLFKPDKHLSTHVKLNEALKERASDLFARWPSAVINFETFLKKQSLTCTYRREPKDPYADRIMRYSNTNLAIQISTENAWQIQFADLTTEPDRWYSFSSIRRLIEWPTNKKLPFPEIFKFIEIHWLEIMKLFSPSQRTETHSRLQQLEAQQNA